MGLMEPGCKLEAFGRLAQPAASNRLRCQVLVVSERYLVEAFWVCVCGCLCVVSYVNVFLEFFLGVAFTRGFVVLSL